MRILTVNAGSSSLKLRLLDLPDAAGVVDDVAGVVEESSDLAAGASGFDTAVVASTLRSWPLPDSVVHRVVHGGVELTGATVVDRAVREQLESLTALAPLHQPKSLAGLDLVSHLLPGVPAVACFDTAFHATIPPAASTYAIPAEWRERWAIRRYGFHGLSHAYASRRAAEILGRPTSDLRIITCHLGAGASLCAVVAGRSVDTTMGFTPLSGLVMATRSGDIDPGLILWLEEHEQLAPHEIATALEERSGLLALAGTSDLQQISASAGRGDERSQLAMGVYIRSLAAGIASMSASAGGIDVLVFTGGVGENSSTVRRLAVEQLRFLGLELDHDRNEHPHDVDVSSSGASVRTVVVGAREDLQMAGEARQLLH